MAKEEGKALEEATNFDCNYGGLQSARPLVYSLSFLIRKAKENRNVIQL